jgi:lantibiotic biosynthesis protein
MAAVEPLIEADLIWRMDVGTYEREVERYGGEEAVEPAERLFEADSDAVLEVVNSAEGDRLAQVRWQLALAGTDRLLRDLGLTEPQREEWARATRASLLSEELPSTELSAEVGRRFRANRDHLDDLLAGRTGDPVLAAGLATLERRSAQLVSVQADLDTLESHGALTQPITVLARSFVHMHINRMLRSDQRRSEMVIADWLGRLYRSARARVPT